MSEVDTHCLSLAYSIGRITIYTMILPLVIGLYYKNKLNKPLKIFLLYCFSFFFLNMLELFYSEITANKAFFGQWLEITGNTTNFFFILYQLISFGFLGWFYSFLLRRYNYHLLTKNISNILIGIAIISFIFEQGWINYGVVGPAIEALYLFILPFFYLWFLFKSSLALPVTKNSYFWISLGLITPNLIGLFLYFTGDFFQKVDFCLFTRLIIAKNSFLIIGQIFIAIGFWRAPFAKYLD